MKTYLVHPLVSDGEIKGAKVVEKPTHITFPDGLPIVIDDLADAMRRTIQNTAYTKALQQSIDSALTFENQDLAVMKMLLSPNMGSFGRKDLSGLYDSLSWRVTEVEQYRYKDTDLPWTDCPDHTNPPKFEYRTVLRLVEEKEATPDYTNYTPPNSQPEAPKEDSQKELLRKYSEFLENYSYMDDDWRSEVPNAIDRFLVETITRKK